MEQAVEELFRKKCHNCRYRIAKNYGKIFGQRQNVLCRYQLYNVVQQLHYKVFKNGRNQLDQTVTQYSTQIRCYCDLCKRRCVVCRRISRKFVKTFCAIHASSLEMSFARLTLMPEPNFRFFKIYISMSRLYRLALETSPRWLYFLNTRTHAHTHTHTLTHTHSRTDTLSHARTHTHTRLVVALCERGEKR